jgi:four helix bundle protein
VLGAHELVVSDTVLHELEEVLLRKVRAPESTVVEVLAVFDDVEIVKSSQISADIPGLDPVDAGIVATALESRADVFVTGDREILATARRLPLPVISPRRFMELEGSMESPYPEPTPEDDLSVSEPPLAIPHDQAFELALEAVRLCHLLETRCPAGLVEALLRSAASIGWTLEGARGVADSRTAREAIAEALLGARQTEYWLRLIDESDVAPDIDLEPLRSRWSELVRLLEGSRGSGAP